MPDLAIQNLHHSGLKCLDLHIPGGSTLCLQGASGSGKTLLLRAIADLDPNQGEITLGEEKRSTLTAHQWRQQVIYVPSESHWWKNSVAEHAKNWSSIYLQALGFESDVLSWSIKRLSSGERQRLAIVRTLSHEPAALLLDEPTANLDPDNSLKVEQLINHYQQEHQSPIIWVSHDAQQCKRISDTTFILNKNNPNER